MELPRRPLVVVEDHLYHIDRLLELLHQQQPQLLPRLTVVCLDRRGPDTQAAADRWVAEHADVLVVADVEPSDPRQRALPAAVLEQGNAYALMVAGLLAPRGVLLQDIQLETLRFVPVDQWWETIYLASTVRGMYADRPPQCIFSSNKRGFHATFGKDLLSVGFDPRDVLHKDELGHTLVPLLVRRLRDAFPLELQVTGEGHGQWLTRDAAEVERLSAELDLVLWEDRAAKLVLRGRGVVTPRGGGVELVPDGHEASTWRALVEAHLHGGPGIPTRALGERVAPELALRAEQSTAAARLVYALRRRLRAPDALLTVDHCYRLAEEFVVGRVRLRRRTPEPGASTGTS
ncbi:MAG: hypothetical protein KDK70_35760 [Myxococcales bacterium]|nr:hypothetical protein [Myxococcales bacterium]